MTTMILLIFSFVFSNSPCLILMEEFLDLIIQLFHLSFKLHAFCNSSLLLFPFSIIQFVNTLYEVRFNGLRSLRSILFPLTWSRRIQKVRSEGENVQRLKACASFCHLVSSNQTRIMPDITPIIGLALPSKNQVGGEKRDGL